MQAQFSKVAIEEDDAKFTIKLDPCGKSGRMLEERQDQEPTNPKETPRGYDWICGKKNVP
jgi:hypothetical protein